MLVGRTKNPNAFTHRLDGVTEIYLTQGKVALVDTADYPIVSGYRWYAGKGRKTWYAETSIPASHCQSGTTRLRMHTLIMPHAEIVDHKFGDGLDNRRLHLRAATHGENLFNQPKKGKSTSRFVGVCWYKPLSKWHAYITVDGRIVHIGYFENEEDAGRARKDAEAHYRPEFQRLV